MNPTDDVILIHCANPGCRAAMSCVNSEPHEDAYSLAEDSGWSVDGDAFTCSAACSAALAGDAGSAVAITVAAVDLWNANGAARKAQEKHERRCAIDMQLAVQFDGHYPDNFVRMAHEHAVQARAYALEADQLAREAGWVAA